MYTLTTTLASNRLKNSRGMTLIEIMIVLAIIGGILALVGTKAFDMFEKSKQKNAFNQIQLLGQALDLYRMEAGCYPETEQGLKALVEKPSVGKVPSSYPEDGYLKKKELPKDPYDNDYEYTRESCSKYKITYFGRDREAGGTGYDKDITSDDTKIE